MLSVRRGRGPRGLVAALMACACIQGADPAGSADSGDNLAGLSLEELTRVEVTSVARKDQKLSKVAAAVYVITADDIRRSGATCVPELLRVVPGIEVAQIASNTWAISARGFNSRSSNKILVLVDGRSIYNDLFSGTFWDQNQVPLDDIERIEVIRGPGATMWGANAVNGIISIITKRAKETQGLMVSTVASQAELPDASVRYGGHAGDNVQYRLDAHFVEDLPLLTANGAPAGDRSDSGQGGGRIDWRISDRDSLTLDGQIYQGGGNEQVDPAFPLHSGAIEVTPLKFSGGFARGRWERRFDRSDIALQLSYTDENRAEWIAHGALRTLDLDFEHHIALNARNDFNWGGGYRYWNDNGIGLLGVDNPHESLVSVFAQDEFALVPARLSLTGGIKVQDFLYDGKNHPEIQPQVRLLWTPGKRDSFWGAVSRAVRMPSEVERNLELTFALPPSGGIPVSGLLQGNPALPGEVLIAYEAGYRRQFGTRFSLDVAGFYNRYSQLIQTVSNAPEFEIAASGPEIIAPETYSSTGKANTRGIEVAGSWNPTRNWRLQLAWAWENANFASPPSLTLTTPPGAMWATPEHAVNLQSSWDVTRHWSLDASVYGVTAIEGRGVPGYARVGIRVARRIGEGGEISGGVQNLFDNRQLEFIGEDYIISSYLRRNAFARIVWRF